MALSLPPCCTTITLSISRTFFLPKWTTNTLNTNTPFAPPSSIWNHSLLLISDCEHLNSTIAFAHCCPAYFLSRTNLKVHPCFRMCQNSLPHHSWITSNCPAILHFVCLLTHQWSFEFQFFFMVLLSMEICLSPCFQFFWVPDNSVYNWGRGEPPSTPFPTMTALFYIFVGNMQTFQFILL